MDDIIDWVFGEGREDSETEAQRVTTVTKSNMHLLLVLLCPTE